MAAIYMMKLLRGVWSDNTDNILRMFVCICVCECVLNFFPKSKARLQECLPVL